MATATFASGAGKEAAGTVSRLHTESLRHGVLTLCACSISSQAGPANRRAVGTVKQGSEALLSRNSTECQSAVLTPPENAALESPCVN